LEKCCKLGWRERRSARLAVEEIAIDGCIDALVETEEAAGNSGNEQESERCQV